MTRREGKTRLLNQSHSFHLNRSLHTALTDFHGEVGRSRELGTVSAPVARRDAASVSDLHSTTTAGTVGPVDPWQPLTIDWEGGSDSHILRGEWLLSNVWFLVDAQLLTRAGGVEALLPLDVLSPAVVQRVTRRAGPLPAHGARTTGSAAGTPRTPGAPGSASFFVSGTSEWR